MNGPVKSKAKISHRGIDACNWDLEKKRKKGFPYTQKRGDTGEESATTDTCQEEKKKGENVDTTIHIARGGRLKKARHDT